MKNLASLLTDSCPPMPKTNLWSFFKNRKTVLEQYFGSKSKKKKVFTQFSSHFSPKIRWRAKTKKKVFTQILSHFSPKIRWRAKKKRSSLKFRPIFRPNSGEEQKKRSSLKISWFQAQSQMPNLQRGGGGHASILLTFLCNFAILATQRGRPWPNGPPKYAPGDFPRKASKKSQLYSHRSVQHLFVDIPRTIGHTAVLRLCVLHKQCTYCILVSSDGSCIFETEELQTFLFCNTVLYKACLCRSYESTKLNYFQIRQGLPINFSLYIN